MNKKKLRPVILAGGSGRRLWPLSTKEKPKQFIPIFGEYSLFDLTLQRLNQGTLFSRPVIVTSKDYLDYVEGSTIRTGIEPEKIILEPSSRNTLPAVSLAVMISLLSDRDENFLVTPSDHYISKNKGFHEACRLAKSNVGSGGLFLFGIKPERPSADYGYITAKNIDAEINQVKGFIEKPDIHLATELINKEGALWNSGMFAFKGSWFLNTFESLNNSLFKEIDGLIPKKNSKSLYFSPNKDQFNKILDSQFDKVFVEKNTNNLAIILDAGWSDLGSWGSLGNLQKDLKHEMTLFSENTPIKEERPWGYFEVLMETEDSKVKLLSVLPGHKLSLQRHKHRSETWYVIRGEAKITKGNERFTMVRGDSVIIRQNEQHRLENTAQEPLEIIEIQSGTYFGEDDIIRIKDSYGRADLH